MNGDAKSGMTFNDSANAYLRTKVMSATPEELRLMLLDGALRFATQAKEGLEAKDYERSFAGFSQCRDIIMELIRTIKPSHNPELAENVKALYLFMYSELVESSFEKDISKVEQVLELLKYERETWVLLMDQLAAEKRGTPIGADQVPATGEQPGQQPAQPAPAQTATVQAPAARPNPYAAQQQRAPISIQA